MKKSYTLEARPTDNGRIVVKKWASARDIGIYPKIQIFKIKKK